MLERVHFTDVDKISAYSTGSQWSEWGRSKLIPPETIRRFADLTCNHQWIHEDEVRCTRESPYGSLIAHGLLLVSFIPALLPKEDCMLWGYNVRVIRGIDRLRLPSPVYPSDSIHARVRRMKAYAAQSGKGTIIERDVEVWSQRGIKPAVACMLKMQYF